MKKQLSKEELREEVKSLTADIKKKLNCEKFAPNTWIKEVEEKCTEANKLGAEERHLIIENGYWIVRDCYYPGVDAEVTNYYYFTQEPTVEQIEYMRWLSDIYADMWAGEACDFTDTEISTFRAIKRLKAKLFDEAMEELNFDEEMTEKAKKIFETKKKLVNEDKSEVFREWNEFSRIKKEEFIKGLKWLESDPMVSVGGKVRESREIGCKEDGSLVYGEIYYIEGFRVIYPIDLNLSSLDFPRRTLNKRDIL
nr:MAG TPA: hypothetical protein [Caudoviricetes sp.]